jgi:hypothetical protein
VYFAREVWEHVAYGVGNPSVATESSGAGTGASGDLVLGPAGNSMATVRSSTTTYGVSRVNCGRRYNTLGYFMRVPAGAEVATDLPYTPLLTIAWSDSWFFCDGLLLLGVIGTSPDVVTADVVCIMLAVLYSAAAHAAFMRLMYDGYVEDAPGTDFRSANFDKLENDDKKRQGLRVMTMLADFATIFFVVITCYLVFQRYGNAPTPVIMVYVIVCFLVPNVFWFIFNLIVDFELIPCNLLSWSQMVFVFNVLVRGAFVIVAAAQANHDADANFSGDTSLKRLLMLANK